MTDNLHKLDIEDEWKNGAYDETGACAVCDICGEDLYYDPTMNNYYCRSCGNEMSREEFLKHIGATIPGEFCKEYCTGNYPLCKQQCKIFSFDPNDPMLT